MQNLGHLVVQGSHNLIQRLDEGDVEACGMEFSAISSPMSPPPTIAADWTRLFRIISRSRSASGTVQSVTTRGESIPGIPGRRGDEPEAITSTS